MAIIFTAFLFLSGCATPPTKPNIPYSGPLPELDEIAKKNSLLATELRKLPELQDGISAVESYALKSLLKLYDNAPDAFNSAFNEMYKVGLPNVRKYCSPLQALFWLAEDGKLRKEDNPLVDYSLDKLLGCAWKFEEKFVLILSEKEAKKVIDGIKDEDEKKDYSYLTRIEDIKKIILIDYNRNPNMFLKEAREIIEKSLRENIRWGDYETVVERLNNPKLLNFYQRRNFSYWTDRGSRFGYSKFLFKSKKGDCRDYTAFSVYCLQKSGYGAMAIKVVSPSGAAFHVVCEYKENGKEYIMDNSCRMCGSGKGITEKQIYVRVLPKIGTGYLH